MERWVKPEEFVEHSKTAESLGFAGGMAEPLVRSSYSAGRLYAQTKAHRGETLPDNLSHLATEGPAAQEAALAARPLITISTKEARSNSERASLVSESHPWPRPYKSPILPSSHLVQFQRVSKVIPMALVTDLLNWLQGLPEPGLVAAAGRLVFAECTIGLGFIAPGGGLGSVDRGDDRHHGCRVRPPVGRRHGVRGARATR